MATRPKACVFHRSPEKDYNVLVGDTVELRLRIKNCGGDRGNFYSDINKDGGAWIAKYNESLDPGELGTFLKKSFTMPNREVKVDFKGGHAWSGDWSEDFHYTAYLRPRKEYCTQEIEVTTKDGVRVTATVDWGDGTSDSGTTPKTFSHQYEVVIGKSYEIEVSASGYYREIISLTLPCKPKITSILPKKTETCDQRVRVVTSDGASVRARLEWGDGTHEDFNTPKTCFHDRYEKGKTYTVTASATGYTSASKRIDRACISQFTLTLTKEAAAECDTYTRKSSCEAAGCYWYNNACHEYGPVKCSDYTDALTCAANNCYWWSDGTCHDTEEVVGDEKWKTVSEPYWSGKWVKIDYEMQNPDTTPFLPPNYPYLYYYVGEPWIGGVCKTKGGSNMQAGGVLTGQVLFAGNVGDVVTLKLAKIDRDNVSVVHSYTDEVTKTIPPKVTKKDTVICDFNVYDAADKKATDLVAGVRYAVKAYLCKVEGGGCAEILKGCDSGCEVEGGELKLAVTLPTHLTKDAATGTTNIDGYTGMFWTPDIGGTHKLQLEFKGSAKYNASETAWKTVKVSIVIPTPPTPPILKDCMICSFDIVDANGKSVTELVVGARYTVKCNIYDKAILGCVAPIKKELIGKEIKFIKT